MSSSQDLSGCNYAVSIGNMQKGKYILLERCKYRDPFGEKTKWVIFITAKLLMFWSGPLQVR